MKLLLFADVKNCYKERVLLLRAPAESGNADKRGKALTGTAYPVSAKIDLCTVSVVVV